MGKSSEEGTKTKEVDMKYEENDIFRKSIKAVENNNLYFIDEIIAYLPCGKTTFYTLFPADSDKMNAIKETLDVNRVNTKVGMRKKWYDSDNATLQVALMKLISSEEEAHRLNGTKQEIEHKGDNLGVQIYLPDNNRDSDN